MKRILTVFLCALLLSPVVGFSQDKLQIATMNTNRAINESNEGVKLQKLLVAQKKQADAYLQTKVQELKQKQAELQNSVMLTEKAKQEKYAEMQKLYVALQREKSKTDRDFRGNEKRYLETIFTRMKPVVNKVAKAQKFDMVLDDTIVKGLLYHNLNIIDITDQVIAEFNKLSNGK
ncbi:MAG: OmpH family outer membrane protein [Deltaproteobacteria bacterium]|jgi:outer membrane protein|nr:OmpH family outer membrane protein [Deltaproteobacteria bacterium]MBT4525088.1 OmpH family outer membrane protein [Deltaproteobacteria bacterium]